MGQYKRHVFVCTHGEYCPFEGGGEVHRILKSQIAARGLQNSIRINKAGCFSQCGNGPIVVVYPENIWYGAVNEEKARRILEEHLLGGRPVSELQYQAPAGPNKNGRRMAAIDASRRATDCGSSGGTP
jgi:(2Fe-2S) ferredoxin